MLLMNDEYDRMMQSVCECISDVQKICKKVTQENVVIYRVRHYERFFPVCVRY
jgi:hypothetical protein